MLNSIVILHVGLIVLVKGLKTATKKLCVATSRDSRKSGALIVRYMYSKKKEYISFVFYCFENLSFAITVEQLVRFRWGFEQTVPFLIRTSMK